MKLTFLWKKTSKFSPFLQEYCKQGGSVPAPSHLRSDYLPQLFPQDFEAIKQAVHGSPVYVIADETTDACGCCVLAILLQPVNKSPVAADQIFLNRVNFSTVSQAVISCLNSKNINFNDVWAFVTDSASYMKMAYNNSPWPLPQCQTCHLSGTSAVIGFRGVPRHI